MSFVCSCEVGLQVSIKLLQIGNSGIWNGNNFGSQVLFFLQEAYISVTYIFDWQFDLDRLDPFRLYITVQ